MAHPPKGSGRSLAQEQRRARLAAELRSNLAKRKDQARGRTQQAAPAQAPEAGQGQERDEERDEGRDGREDQPDAPEAAVGDKTGPQGRLPEGRLSRAP
jgi:hypothetical protein